MEETTEQTRDAEAYYLLENEQVFSQSQIWEMQRHYFESMGVDAWRRGEVPHYITSNPRIANSYAEIVFALLRDRQRLAPTDEPLTICELGAGSGRFAFHFLSRLRRLCAQTNVPLRAFRYILTDLAPSNLEFWRQHPHFQPFFDAGVLDCALFDINRSKELTLQVSEETIGVGALHQPLVVIANYVFDGIPQDLFFIHADRCDECLVTLYVRRDRPTPTVADLIAALESRLDHRPLAKPPYREPYLKRILEEYQRTLAGAYVLFPATGLRCMHRLRALSRQGVALLSADKGDHRLSALRREPALVLAVHGSFSLNVNYHAFGQMCEQRGGIALFPTTHHRGLNVGCLLMVPEPSRYVETIGAYQRHVEECGPDDFYSLFKHAREQCATCSLEDILAYLRLSLYDPYQFASHLPRLIELVATCTKHERADIIADVEKLWEEYFPLGEAYDLADQIARLLYAMDEVERALTFFERSLALYGEQSSTREMIAACQQRIEARERAQRSVAALHTMYGDQ